MNGRQHLDEAKRLADLAARRTNEDGSWMPDARQMATLAAAQVHATIASVYATLDTAPCPSDPVVRAWRR